MALKTRAKIRFDQESIGSRYRFEAYDNPAVDDILAFMAQSEAQRRVQMRRAGQKRESQTPSDELKAFLMDTQG